MHLSDGVCRAFGDAGAASVTHGGGDLGGLSINSLYGAVGTFFLAYAAFYFDVSAFIWDDLSDDGFDFPSWLRKNCGSSCCGSASLRDAVRDVFGSLTGTG